MTPAKTPHTPFLGNVSGFIAEWWRRHAAARATQSGLESLGPDEFARMAHDVGIAPSELRTLAAYCSDAADLLERRLESLGLSATDLAQHDMIQLREMERLCTTCKSKGRCARDLAADPADPVWQHYCPNHETLTALQEARHSRHSR